MRSASRWISASAALALYAGIAYGQVRGSVFSVDQWNLDIGVSGNSPYGDFWGFEKVSNPFTSGSHVVDRDSGASNSFNFWWNDSYGSFLIQNSIHCVAQNPPPFPGAIGNETCGSEGGVYFTANAALMLTVDATAPYDLEGPESQAQLILGVWPQSNAPVDPVFSAVRRDDTYGSYSVSGTFRISGQAVVPAGQTYNLTYSQLLTTHRDTGAIADASGYIHFTLFEVPEPTAILLLGLSATILRRRRR